MSTEFIFLIITIIIYIFLSSLDYSIYKYICDLEEEQFINLCKSDEIVKETKEIRFLDEEDFDF